MSQQAPDGQERETPPEPEITWVGQQWRMEGYCGRATPEPALTPPAAVPPAPEVDVRPVAVVKTRRSQGRVVRIGPRKEMPAA
jgi:hypothetical protein